MGTGSRADARSRSPESAVCEIQIHDDEADRLISVIELVSPANKDRPEHRRQFVAKCASYLNQQISLVIVDIVTERHADLHVALLEQFTQDASHEAERRLYAVAYRMRSPTEKWALDYCPMTLVVGEALPTVPLWLRPELTIRLDLEQSYEETSRVLRIR